MLNHISERIAKSDDLKRIITEWRPFTDPDMLKAIREFHRVPIVYSSNAIEGCTYSESETRILLEEGIIPPKKRIRETEMVTSLNKVYDMMFNLLRENSLTQAHLLSMHHILGDSLENDAIAGEFRKQRVFITGATHSCPSPSKVHALMEKLFTDYANGSDAHPLERAAKFHAELAYIHPFADGNGRVARMAMNTILVQSGFLPIIIPPIRRDEYCQLLDKAHSNMDPFIDFIVENEIYVQQDFVREFKHFMQAKDCSESTRQVDHLENGEDASEDDNNGVKP